MIRYEIDPEQLDAFERYARTWTKLIEKYGGVHHGYYIPAADPPDAPFSFSDLGREGPGNVAVALFSFSDNDAYETYRRAVVDDPDCLAATVDQRDSHCFTSYERTFLTPIER